MDVREELAGSTRYYALLPQQRPAEPWGLLVDQLYLSLLMQPILFSECKGGMWVSPSEAVFTPTPTTAVTTDEAPMHAALLRSGMPLVRVPPAVFELLQSAARAAGFELKVADAPTVREWLRASEERQEGLSREEGLSLLSHCLADVAAASAAGIGGGRADELHGLRLVPMSDGKLGLISHVGCLLWSCAAQVTGSSSGVVRDWWWTLTWMIRLVRPYAEWLARGDECTGVQCIDFAAAATLAAAPELAGP